MNIRILFATLACAALLSCGHTEDFKRHTDVYAGDRPPDIPQLTFIKVPTSFFTFNETPNGRAIQGADAPFEVIQNEFWITTEPVEVSFYESYLGSYPKKGMSYDRANRLLDAVYRETGLPVILPTEAMHEAALLHGAIKLQSRYRYLVSDGWVPRTDVHRLETDWESPLKDIFVTTRSITERLPVEHYRSGQNYRFYIARRTPPATLDDLYQLLDFKHEGTPEPSDSRKETFAIGQSVFTMVPVDGGRAVLGATPEQERWAGADELPVREVELPPFKIASTEVTCGLWKEVMGFLPAGNNPHHPERPVGNVSWYDTQEFLQRLRSLTGRTFRLPSEDEWEYAARGGRGSRGYIYSGGDKPEKVAVCSRKDKENKTLRPDPSPVASLRPNELGLYDMSGGVWEWVRGAHPDGGALLKGGSRLSTAAACRPSNRQSMEPTARKDSFGFRIAL